MDSPPLARNIRHRPPSRRIFGPRVPVSRQLRAVWAVVALAGCSVLGIAAWLVPAECGYGTHEQLFTGPCAAILISGMPCPTCGMTTSFSMVMHGRLYDAFIAQPAGMLLCLATMLLVVHGVQVLLTGRTLTVNWHRVGPVRFMLGLGLLILLGWAMKMAHGLMTGTLPVQH